MGWVMSMLYQGWFKPLAKAMPDWWLEGLRVFAGAWWVAGPSAARVALRSG
jgi:hypothetical protein